MYLFAFVSEHTLIASKFLKDRLFICGQKFSVIRFCFYVILVSVKSEKVPVSEIGLKLRAKFVYIFITCK